MADQDTSWRTADFRNKVIGQIEDAIRQTGNPTNKSSMEMENHVFQKAKTREEYLALVARLIIHVRDINSKKEKANMMVAQPGLGGQPGGNLFNDPMSALQNLTRTPNPMPGQPPTMQNQMMGGQMGMPQQRPPFQTYQQPGGMPGQPGGMPGMPGQPGGMPGQPGGMPGQPGGIQGQPGGMQGQPQGLIRQQRMPGMQNPQDNFMIQQQQQQQQMLQQQQLQQQQQQQNMGLGAPGMGGVRQTMPAQFSNPGQPIGFQPGASPAGGLANSQPALSTSAPSPASVAVSSYGTMASPAMLPSPGQTTVAPSPASRAGAPSPSAPLNTPGNPSSTGPAPSPQSSQTTNAEEQAYLDKLKQLRKYIEPLKRMVAKIEKEEERKHDLGKMKNLLGILSDSNMRLPFGTLLKCEQVLEKLDFQTKTSGSSGLSVSTSTSVTKADQQHMCQPLIDAVAQHIQHPMLNHTLNRTFGPAIQALHGTPIRSDSPPNKKQKVAENGIVDKIPNLVQGEVARLEDRFRVKLDPQHQEGSRTIHLVCALHDKHLPAVPPLSLTVPEDYPDSSPTCDTSADEYTATPFLENVQKNLSSQLLHLPEKYSISALLDLWELSIRQMSSPAHNK